MLTVQIHNDGTGTNESANYDYEVSVNGQIIRRGRVEGFNRDEGWQSLLYEIAEQVNFEQGKEE